MDHRRHPQRRTSSVLGGKYSNDQETLSSSKDFCNFCEIFISNTRVIFILFIRFEWRFEIAFPWWDPPWLQSLSCRWAWIPRKILQNGQRGCWDDPPAANVEFVRNGHDRCGQGYGTDAWRLPLQFAQNLWEMTRLSVKESMDGWVMAVD